MNAMPLRTDTQQPGTPTTPGPALAVGSVAAAHSSDPMVWHGDYA